MGSLLTGEVMESKFAQTCVAEGSHVSCSSNMDRYCRCWLSVMHAFWYEQPESDELDCKFVQLAELAWPAYAGIHHRLNLLRGGCRLALCSPIHKKLLRTCNVSAHGAAALHP